MTEKEARELAARIRSSDDGSGAYQMSELLETALREKVLECARQCKFVERAYRLRANESPVPENHFTQRAIAARQCWNRVRALLDEGDETLTQRRGID